MRLPRWLVLVLSIGMLVTVGAVAVSMNRAALRTAESVHRRDTAAMAANNTTLVSSYLQISAKELLDLTNRYPLRLTVDDQDDRQVLLDLVAKSMLFRYGAALTDLTGAVLNQTSSGGLPAPTDVGFVPMRQGLLAGGAGYSTVMSVNGVAVTAVAVPVLTGGLPRGVLIGFTRIDDSQLQGYVTRLTMSDGVIGVTDAAGVVAAASDPALLGQRLGAGAAAGLRSAPAGKPTFVRYTEGAGPPMLAVVVTGAPGGWSYFRLQSEAGFYGGVRGRSMLINLAVLVLILLAAVALLVANHRAETGRRRVEERFRAMIQHAPDLILVLDATGHATYESPSVSRVLAREPGTMLGRPAADLVHPEDQPAVTALLTNLLTRPRAVERTQCRIRPASGGERWVDLSMANLLHSSAIGGVVINGRDVSDSRELQERLSYQAMHDSLTDLPNRRFFQDRLRRALNRPGPAPTVAVLFVDLDRFKAVNDVHGHDAGDELLRQVGRRLGSCVRLDDVVARVGGDEFIVLLDGIASEEEAVGVAERAVTSIGEPFWIFGQQVRVGASVGISYAAAGDDAEDTLRSADAAMYTAKQGGGLTYRTAVGAAAGSDPGSDPGSQPGTGGGPGMGAGPGTS